MKVFILIFVAFILTNPLVAQKKIVDQSALSYWPTIRSPQISNDGNYVSYSIDKGSTSHMLIVRSTHTSWRKEVLGSCSEILFSGDSKWLVWRNSGDSLGILDLQKNSLEYIKDVSEYAIHGLGDHQWIVCRSTVTHTDIILTDLFTGVEKKYSGIKDYLFSPNGTVLLLNQESKNENITQHNLIWHHLSNDDDTVIGRNDTQQNFVFSHSGNRLLYFTSRPAGGLQFVALKYFYPGMDSAITLTENTNPSLEGMFLQEGDAFFSTFDDKVFFYVKTPDNDESVQNAKPSSGVKIHRYSDDSLEFETRHDPYLSVIDLSNPLKIRILGLNKDDGYSLSEGSGDNYIAFESNRIGSSDDYCWRIAARPDIYLSSVKTGRRTLLSRRLVSYDLSFSPRGNYFVWYDREQRQWFSFNVGTDKLINITKKIQRPLYTSEDYPQFSMSEGIAGWLKNDETVLIYGRFDIWQVDLSGKKDPVNLTKGYGARNHICFRIWSEEDRPQSYSPQDSLLLIAFDYKIKNNGFFKMALNSKSGPESLVMEAKLYFFQNSRPDFCGAAELMYPRKAKDANMYLVERMSAGEYPNLYTTRDFKHFDSVTDFEPQKSYNWYTSELVHWKLPGGKEAEGLLYKPEDFDSTKKYPVILHYYDKNANSLNIFIHPELSNGIINIPWFVSQGYIVFVPNIDFIDHDPGQSVYNAVVSAALYMSKQPWVNSHKIGLQGHSFGGWETNYIIAHSKLFAAAASSSGASDLIRNYEEMLPSADYYEQLQGRMGVSLCDNIPLYIKNSPLFAADKVSTPLLIMSNRCDYAVPYEQGKAWYNALIRQKKKVWMLSYEGEGHVIEKEENKSDYTIRLTQFFDHFLKDMPAPKWMTTLTTNYH